MTGGVAAMTGPSGYGKPTFLNIVNRLDGAIVAESTQHVL
jgi:ABC-type phosphate transport system ATPase subunit